MARFKVNTTWESKSINFCDYYISNLEKLHRPKVWTRDRSNFSKLEARSTVWLSSIRPHVNSNTKKLKYQGSTKGFEWVKLTKLPLGYMDSLNKSRVPGNKAFNKNGTPTSEFEDACYVNIKGDSSVKYHSKAPFKTGKRPTRTYGMDYKAKDFFTNPEYCPNEFLMDDVSEDCVVKGGFSGSMPHFANYARDNYSKSFNLSRMKRAIPRVIARFQRPFVFNKPGLHAIWFSIIKPKANPGGDTSNYFKLKGDAWASCCKAAQILSSRVQKELSPAWSIYTLGDRAKRCKNTKPGKSLECRLVMMQDMVEYLIMRPWSALIERFIFTAEVTPVKLGRSNAREGHFFNSLNDRMYPYCKEGDWEKYDSTLPPDVIIAAFGLMRGMFPEGHDVDNIFCYFCSGFLNKFVVQNDGNVFKVGSGNPSGTGWTALANSFGNALLLEDSVTSYRGMGSKCDFTYDVSGDDCKIFFAESYGYSTEKFCQHVKNRWNMVLKIRMNGTPISNNPDESIEFLKTALYWKDGVAIPTTPPRSLATRLRLPQRRYFSLEMQNFIFSQSGSLVNCDRGKELVSNFLAFYKNYDNLNDELKYRKDIEDIRNFIDLFNDQVYFDCDSTIKVENFFTVANDRVRPIYKEGYSLKIDMKFVWNWLIDNSTIYFKKFIKTSDRIDYFKRMMAGNNSTIEFAGVIDKHHWKLTRLWSIPADKIRGWCYDFNELYWDSPEASTRLLAKKLLRFVS